MARFPEVDNGAIANLLERFFPIGFVYISTKPTNPSDLLGVGVWQAVEAGRSLVTVNASDPDFDIPKKLGGSKTHTLLATEMPVHTHLQNAHNHQQNAASVATGGLVGSTPDASTNTSVASGYSTANATAVNQNAGGGLPHNNLQPYVTVFAWERVA